MAGSVVITGASTGIGRATALYLDQCGLTVFAGVRKKVDAESLRKEGSPRLHPIYIDLLKLDSIRDAARIIERELDGGGLDGLVNNAGISVGGPLEFVELDELRMQLEVNVTAQVAVTQIFLPLLRRERGRIVNIGSIGGRVASPMLGPYAASKFALEALSDSLRVELSTFGMYVSLIEPGAIDTPIFGKGSRRADEQLEGYPEHVRELYEPGLQAVRDAFDEMSRTAAPPVKVARAVHHALTARRPRTRYLVGLDAKLQATLARFLPDRAKDWLLTRMLRYPS